jgi:hypothetical protein
VSEESCFEILDAVNLARLEKRTPDLDGSVPLRVAQACVPLLEGNAFGFQITLTRAIEVRKSLGRVTAEIADPHREAVLAAHRAALARLVAQGFLARTGYWHRFLEKGPVQVERAGFGRARVRLWTGLLARPDHGVFLRVSGTANRRNLLVEVDEVVLAEHDALVPVVLDLALRDGAPDRVRLEGEIATIAPVLPDVAIEERALADELDLGRAHTCFYDAAYFAAKKADPTRKYRRLVAREDDGTDDAPARCQLVAAGPTAQAIVTTDRFLGASGPATSSPAGGVLRSILFTNLVPFEARFDGHTLTVDPDRAALAAGARAVEETWEAAFGAGFVSEHRGALWYLTKYFTPHPPGEPHFFVKPWSFTRTPRGFSSLLEGLHGDGWDVLRGVVSTDVFFATPAVFRVQKLGDPIRVGAGEPLLSVLPIPRRLLGARFREVRWRDE